MDLSNKKNNTQDQLEELREFASCIIPFILVSSVTSKLKNELEEPKEKEPEKEYKTLCGCLEEFSNYGILIYKNKYLTHGTISEYSISINSCCGGCVSLNDLKYCPYCQILLKVVEK